jgi:hypothetical protein
MNRHLKAHLASNSAERLNMDTLNIEISDNMLNKSIDKNAEIYTGDSTDPKKMQNEPS